MKHLILLLFVLIVSACNSTDSQNNQELLSAADFSQHLLSDEEIILLDVRTPEEVEEGFIANARNINFTGDGFADSLSTLDPSKKYFIYCASGKRGSKALNVMKEKGFKRITNLEGGFNAWKAMGLPVVKP